MKKYDYVIVGAGLFGSIFAREMTDRGFKCLVIDKRNHIGGNCYTENKHDIEVHKYGPHIFHTNNKSIWDYINKYTEFNNFVYRPKVNFENVLYSFPINLFTLHQLWGIKNPEEAKKTLEDKKINIINPKNLEEYAISQVGEEIYRKFIYGYTKKQWGKEPKELPLEIIKRLPIRLTMDDNYFNDYYQGIPKNGYTEIFIKLLNGIELILETDYLQNKSLFDNLSTKIVYTGSIDEFFGYDLGALEWRSLKFENETHDIEDYQGNAAVNYTDETIPFTRIIEHKHFAQLKNTSKTIITKEYPDSWDIKKEKFYPVNDAKNRTLYKKYFDRLNHNFYILGGRLAEYIYYDMHQVIASALQKINKELNT